MTGRGAYRAVWRAGSVAALAIIAGAAPRDGSAASASPPRVWQSDVSVRLLEVSEAQPEGTVTARVVVAADSDDARAVRLEIMLPVGVGVLQTPNGCRASPGPVTSLSARVSCTLGNMRVGDVRALSITTTGISGGGRPLRFAAFALSDTPDPVVRNNFVERALR